MKWTDTSPTISYPVLQGLSEPLVAGRIHLSADLRPAVLAHIRQSDVEMGGLLIGYAGRTHEEIPPDRFDCIWIIAACPAISSEGSAISLRMDAQVWTAANAQIEQLHTERPTYPKPVVVGWYHSHPGIGAFFSGTDRQTQAAFFRNPYSLGWVIDPSDQSEAWFIGADSQPIATDRILVR